MNFDVKLATQFSTLATGKTPFIVFRLRFKVKKQILITIRKNPRRTTLKTRIVLDLKPLSVRRIRYIRKGEKFVN